MMGVESTSSAVLQHRPRVIDGARKISSGALVALSSERLGSYLIELGTSYVFGK